MAGTIAADTLTHSSAGSIATNYVVEGSAKNWLAFDGTASTPTARGSFNHSSITDHGTGDFTNNFTSSLADVNYAPLVLGSHDSSNLYTGLELTSIATGAVRFETKYAPNATKYNMTDNICTIHGDLA